MAFRQKITMGTKKKFIKSAEDFCLQNKQRLTKPRIEVLKIISSSSKPLGAYEILEKLGNKIKSPKPPTAYRAIDFWMEHGFIHRIESLNAYVVCHADHRHSGGQFMICDDCGSVVESHICDLPKPLKDNAAKNTFTPSRWNIEIHGQCERCHAA